MKNSMKECQKNHYLTEEELMGIYHLQYNDVFCKILTLTEEQFMNVLEKQIITFLGIIKKKLVFSILSKVSNIFLQKYYEDKENVYRSYKTVKQIFQTNQSELEYLDRLNCFLHCPECLDAFHTCGLRLILYNDFVFCLACKRVYNEEQVKMYCNHCGSEYYTKLREITDEEYEYFFPVSCANYHCRIDREEKLKCSRCLNDLYVDISKFNNSISKSHQSKNKIKILFCIKCKQSINVENYNFKCKVCHRNFKSDIKLYNDFRYSKTDILCLVHALLKHKYAFPKNITNKKCKCNLDYAKKYKHFDNGNLFEGLRNGQKVIICDLCFRIFSFDNFDWQCPLCQKFFKKRETIKKISLSPSTLPSKYIENDKEKEKEKYIGSPPKSTIQWKTNYQKESCDSKNTNIQTENYNEGRISKNSNLEKEKRIIYSYQKEDQRRITENRNNDAFSPKNSCNSLVRGDEGHSHIFSQSQNQNHNYSHNIAINNKLGDKKNENAINKNGNIIIKEIIGVNENKSLQSNSPIVHETNSYKNKNKSSNKNQNGKNPFIHRGSKKLNTNNSKNEDNNFSTNEEIRISKISLKDNNEDRESKHKSSNLKISFEKKVEYVINNKNRINTFGNNQNKNIISDIGKNSKKVETINNIVHINLNEHNNNNQNIGKKNFYSNNNNNIKDSIARKLTEDEKSNTIKMCYKNDYNSEIGDSNSKSIPILESKIMTPNKISSITQYNPSIEKEPTNQSQIIANKRSNIIQASPERRNQQIKDRQIQGKSPDKNYKTYYNSVNENNKKSPKRYKTSDNDNNNNKGNNNNNNINNIINNSNKKKGFDQVNSDISDINRVNIKKNLTQKQEEENENEIKNKNNETLNGSNINYDDGKPLIKKKSMDYVQRNIQKIPEISKMKESLDNKEPNYNNKEFLSNRNIEKMVEISKNIEPKEKENMNSGISNTDYLQNRKSQNIIDNNKEKEPDKNKDSVISNTDYMINKNMNNQIIIDSKKIKEPFDPRENKEFIEKNDKIDGEEIKRNIEIKDNIETKEIKENKEIKDNIEIRESKGSRIFSNDYLNIRGNENQKNIEPNKPVAIFDNKDKPIKNIDNKNKNNNNINNNKNNNQKMIELNRAESVHENNKNNINNNGLKNIDLINNRRSQKLIEINRISSLQDNENNGINNKDYLNSNGNQNLIELNKPDGSYKNKDNGINIMMEYFNNRNNKSNKNISVCKDSEMPSTEYPLDRYSLQINEINLIKGQNENKNIFLNIDFENNQMKNEINKDKEPNENKDSGSGSNLIDIIDKSPMKNEPVRSEKNSFNNINKNNNSNNNISNNINNNFVYQGKQGKSYDPKNIKEEPDKYINNYSEKNSISCNKDEKIKNDTNKSENKKCASISPIEEKKSFEKKINLENNYIKEINACHNNPFNKISQAINNNNIIINKKNNNNINSKEKNEKSPKNSKKPNNNNIVQISTNDSNKNSNKEENNPGHNRNISSQNKQSSLNKKPETVLLDSYQKVENEEFLGNYNNRNSNLIYICNEEEATKSPPQNPPVTKTTLLGKSFNSDNYNILQLLGEGTFGKIFLVQDPFTGQKFALKKISVSDDEDLEENKKEFELLMKLTQENPELNVVNIYGIQIKKLDKFNLVMYVLMEAAECDWECEIRNRSRYKAYYTEKELMKILTGLVKTFASLQRLGICHRDVKPQNILCFGRDDYKISDFGEAKKKKIKKVGGDNAYAFEADTSKQTVRGTELYMSPVLFKALHNCPENDTEYNAYKSDVFSLGFCMLLSSCLGFQALYDIRELYDMNKISYIVERYLSNRYSKNYIKLLILMLQIKEKCRPDFIELDSLIKEKYYHK